MSVDVFGRHIGSEKGSQGPPGIGFNLTSKGDFDIGDRKLCNIADPVENSDCVNLKTLREEIKELKEEVLKLINQEKTLDLEALAIPAYSSVKIYEKSHE